MSRRLHYSHRRMLNRLSFAWQPTANLIDPATGQDVASACSRLHDLEGWGLAERQGEDSLRKWRITDAGVIAMAENGAIFAEGNS